MEGPKVILLIDDEEDIVMMLKGLLVRKGYCVLTAYNGKEGLQKIGQTKPDLIVLDINMPEMDGASFYEHIYDRVNKRVQYPVLVLTARANLGELFAKLDVDGFMTKPFAVEAFLREVEIIMRKRYGLPEVVFSEIRNKGNDRKALPELFVIEDDQESLDKIILAFANRGYKLASARTGFEGLEHVMKNPPDMVLIKLGLPDLPGDVLALKLRRMPKTMEIPLVLYRPQEGHDEDAIERSLCEKAGLHRLVDTNDPLMLMKEVERLWQQ